MKRISFHRLPLVRWLPSWVLNKYLLVGAAYLTYMIFLDSNNFRSQYRLYRQMKGLERQHEYYQTQLEQVKADRAQLFSDEKSLEKFARENYFMKMPDETVVVVVEE